VYLNVCNFYSDFICYKLNSRPVWKHHPGQKNTIYINEKYVKYLIYRLHITAIFFFPMKATVIKSHHVLHNKHSINEQTSMKMMLILILRFSTFFL